MEWKLNAPKALNSVDTEMVNLMIVFEHKAIVQFFFLLFDVLFI